MEDAAANPNLKRCSKCGEMKDISEFRPTPTRPVKWYSQCRPCERESDRIRRAANPEKRRESDRRRYARNPGPDIERARKWRFNHLSECRESDKRRYAENSEAFRAASRKWESENPEKVLARTCRRRARKRGAVVPEDAKAVAHFYKDVKTKRYMECYWCALRGIHKNVPKSKRHVDHKMPLAKNGLHAFINLCCACEHCNCSKGAKTPEEFCGQGELFASLMVKKDKAA